MALARTRAASDIIAGPLIRTHPSNPVAVTIALATHPADQLRRADARRLDRYLSGAERRLSLYVDPSPRRAVTLRRLRELADRVEAMPSRQGVALIAGPVDARAVPLHQPVVDRIIVGDAPSYEDLVEATWCIGRVAILHITRRGSRLVCADTTTMWEPGPPWDPLSVVSRDPVARARRTLELTLPGRTPVVVAGEGDLVDDFSRRHRRPDIVASLCGDHSETSMATLAALAQRTLRRRLEHRQRAAMASVSVATARGVAVRGLDAVNGTPQITGRDLLVTEAGAQRHLDPLVLTHLRAQQRPVVVVPNGYLASHGRAAVAPDHRRAVAAIDGPTPGPSLRLVAGDQ